ncbi:gliding motility-associated peptidyl-prolyl isomerase GldI [Aquimarina sp. SS2-1]|uniref:gliding motility-associated peptidyl-prolyl isomerase GldI n=1 Tax=Aquimarina besae TaxID=3342247 RepID=UPI00367027FD
MKHFLLFLSLFTLFFSCKAPEARKPVSISTGSFINESIDRNKELTAREEARILKIIKEDTINKYVASDGGFWYYYEKKDTIATTTAKFGDIVNFNYDIKNLDGDVIYNRKELDTVNYAIDQEDLFFGLREGLKLMKEGETVTFLFPSYQAYGYYGDDHKIGTNIPLISRVTLNKITKQSTKEN